MGEPRRDDESFDEIADAASYWTLNMETSEESKPESANDEFTLTRQLIGLSVIFIMCVIPTVVGLYLGNIVINSAWPNLGFFDPGIGILDAVLLSGVFWGTIAVYAQIVVLLEKVRS